MDCPDCVVAGPEKCVRAKKLGDEKMISVFVRKMDGEEELIPAVVKLDIVTVHLDNGVVKKEAVIVRKKATRPERFCSMT